MSGNQTPGAGQCSTTRRNGLYIKNPTKSLPAVLLSVAERREVHYPPSLPQREDLRGYACGIPWGEGGESRIVLMEQVTSDWGNDSFTKPSAWAARGGRPASTGKNRRRGLPSLESGIATKTYKESSPTTSPEGRPYLARRRRLRGGVQKFRSAHGGTQGNFPGQNTLDQIIKGNEKTSTDNPRRQKANDRVHAPARLLGAVKHARLSKIGHNVASRWEKKTGQTKNTTTLAAIPPKKEHGAAAELPRDNKNDA